MPRPCGELPFPHMPFLGAADHRTRTLPCHPSRANQSHFQEGHVDAAEGVPPLKRLC